MARIKVELLADHATKKKGEIIELLPETATAFIRCGVGRKAITTEQNKAVIPEQNKTTAKRKRKNAN